MRPFAPLTLSFAVILSSLLPAGRLAAQEIDRVINPAEVGSIEKILSSDDMQGRASFSPGIEKAADYIEAQFRAVGLKTWNNGSSYRQPFSMIRSKLISTNARFDGQPLDSAAIIAFTTEPLLQIDEHTGYERDFIRPGDPANNGSALFK